MRKYPLGEGVRVMSARIFQLDDYRRRKASDGPAAVSMLQPVERAASLDVPSGLASSFHFWSGASGRRYVHTVYPLRDCPELPASNFVLVHRDDRGRCSALAVGRLSHRSASLNLAEIRQRGARLGASEVHVHLLAEGSRQMKVIEQDVRSATFTASQH